MTQDELIERIASMLFRDAQPDANWLLFPNRAQQRRQDRYRRLAGVIVALCHDQIAERETYKQEAP